MWTLVYAQLSQHWSQLRYLAESLKRLHPSVSHLSCCRFAAVIRIIILLHDLILAKLQLSDRRPHI